jgi:hypothetical protein
VFVVLFGRVVFDLGISFEMIFIIFHWILSYWYWVYGFWK